MTIFQILDDFKHGEYTILEAEKQIKKLQDQAIKKYIEPYIKTCEEFNGMPVCKNCGLGSTDPVEASDF